jgi:two-component system response regulator AtoC
MTRSSSLGLCEAPERSESKPSGFLYRNARMRQIREALMQAAASDVPVVFQGESGTGKEILARELHRCSPRAAKPFVKLNCAALPSELLESELFGYERGAFTGAFQSTPGKFEWADGGTMLLDEIGDMDLKLQAKLLHVLQDWEFYRLGGKNLVRVNVRLLAATHRDLESAVREGRFREDLYYRLSVINLEIPPLRRRKDEILLLAKHFLEKHQTAGQPVPEISAELGEALLAYDWPGNIRELENVTRKLLVFGNPDVVAEELRLKRRPREAQFYTTRRARTQARPGTSSASLSPLQEADLSHKQSQLDAILTALNSTGWNRRKAASLLNLEYKRLLYQMKKLGIGKGSGHGQARLEDLQTGLIV